jgi:hypothetical protein
MAGTIWLAGFHRVADVDHCAVFLPAVIVQFPRRIRAPLVDLFGLVAASIKNQTIRPKLGTIPLIEIPRCDVFGRTNKHQPRK